MNESDRLRYDILCQLYERRTTVQYSTIQYYTVLYCIQHNRDGFFGGIMKRTRCFKKRKNISSNTL